MTYSNCEIISVIVPIYNVEKYIDRCLMSISEQTYSHLEVLLINDGSIDKSVELCEKYLIDPRFKLYNKENGGLSDARNFGIKKSKGNIISFVDSDDYLDVNFYSKLYKKFIENDLDIIECGFIRTNGENINSSKKDLDCFILSGKEYLKKGIGFPVAWNKLYKKSLFIDYQIDYPLGKINEDEGTTYKLIYYSKKVGFIDDNLYAYYKNNNSIMGSYSIRRLDYIELMDEKASFFYERGEESLYQRARKEEVNGILLNYFKVKYILKDKNILKNLFNLYKKKWKDILYFNEISIASKILIMFSRFFPSLYGFVILKILNKDI